MKKINNPGFEASVLDIWGDDGTIIIFPGPDPERYPRAYVEDTWAGIGYIVSLDEDGNIRYERMYGRTQECE